jgi:hypothetical protein
MLLTLCVCLHRSTSQRDKGVVRNTDLFAQAVLLYRTCLATHLAFQGAGSTSTIGLPWTNARPLSIVTPSLETQSPVRHFNFVE